MESDEFKKELLKHLKTIADQVKKQSKSSRRPQKEKTIDQKQLIQAIKKDLIKQGLKTEIVALEHLKKAEFNAVTQYPFIDPTTNAVRSIDIKGSHSEMYQDQVLSMINKKISMFIECKKSDVQKWVFYTEPSAFEFEKLYRDYLKSDVQKKSMLGQLKRPMHKMQIRTINMQNILESRKKEEVERVEEGRLGLIQMNAIKQKPDQFMDAQIKVLKAVWYYMKNSYRRKKYDPNFELILPVIVFEGQIFEYKTKYISRLLKNTIFDKLEEPETIKEVKYVPFVSNGFPEDPVPVIIDVVTLDYLPTYIELALTEFTELPGKR